MCHADRATVETVLRASNDLLFIGHAAESFLLIAAAAAAATAPALYRWNALYSWAWNRVQERKNCHSGGDWRELQDTFRDLSFWSWPWAVRLQAKRVDSVIKKTLFALRRFYITWVLVVHKSRRFCQCSYLLLAHGLRDQSWTRSSDREDTKLCVAWWACWLMGLV